jgi:hypothetical protein
MKHAITEIYAIYNEINNQKKLATLDFIQENEIVIATPRNRGSHLVYARPCSGHVNNNKPVKVLDAHNKTKLLYLFGEKTWFDTQEELDQHRAEYQAQRAEETARNKAKKEIAAILDTMSTAEIEAILASLQK